MEVGTLFISHLNQAVKKNIIKLNIKVKTLSDDKVHLILALVSVTWLETALVKERSESARLSCGGCCRTNLSSSSGSSTFSSRSASMRSRFSSMQRPIIGRRPSKISMETRYARNITVLTQGELWMPTPIKAPKWKTKIIRLYGFKHSSPIELTSNHSKHIDGQSYRLVVDYFMNEHT